jgi:cell shape-determining protein MreD
MRYAFGALTAFFIALLQASSVEQFRVVGVAPNLLFVLLACWLVIRGLDDVLPMVGVAGVTTSMIGLQTPGLVLLALLPMVGFGIVRELHIIQSEALLALALVFLASLAYESVLMLGIAASGGVFDPSTAMTHVVLPSAALNLAITPLVFVVMRLTRPAATRRRLVY